MLNSIIARMKAEGATSASILEIERCLSGCVSGKKLIEYAIKNRSRLCAGFCGVNEASDGDIYFPCLNCNDTQKGVSLTNGLRN